METLWTFSGGTLDLGPTAAGWGGAVPQTCVGGSQHPPLLMCGSNHRCCDMGTRCLLLHGFCPIDMPLLSFPNGSRAMHVAV